MMLQIAIPLFTRLFIKFCRYWFFSLLLEAFSRSKAPVHWTCWTICSYATTGSLLDYLRESYRSKGKVR